MNARTQYTQPGNWHTGKCICILEICCSKLTYVEDRIIKSPIFLCISVFFLQKAMVQYTIFKTALLYLLKVYPSL